MADQTQEQALTPMKPGEVKELRTIVKGRFQLLNDQLKEREQEIKDAIKAQIEEEYADRRKVLRKELERVQGVYTKYEKAINALIDKANDDGLQLSTKQYYGASEVWSHEDNWESKFRNADFTVMKLKEEVEERYREIAGEKRKAVYQLNEIQWQLLEELASAQLEGASAKAFLARIPSLNTLLPPPVSTNGSLRLEAPKEAAS